MPKPPKLVAHAEIIVWGIGCESSAVTKVRCEPMDGGAWVEVTTCGTYRQPPAVRGERSGAVALDDAETAALVAALLDEALAGREPPPFDLGSSANGSLRATLPLEGGLVELALDDGSPHRLVALGDVILALAERAGLEMDGQFHPLEERRTARLGR